MSDNNNFQFKSVELKSSQLLKLLDTAPIYKKIGKVLAHPAKAGETVVTTLADGFRETENIAKPGDWIVTNTTGEKYIVSEKEFQLEYLPTEQNGVYIAAGFCKAVQNPFNEPIEIHAKWAFVQKGLTNCMIAVCCDKDGIVSGEPYIIDGVVFGKTLTLYN